MLRSIFVSDLHCHGARTTKTLIIQGIGAMFWKGTHLDLFPDLFFSLIEILHYQI